MNADEAVAAAFELLRAGDAGSAERLFREVLVVQADHAGALHGLGAVGLQTGHYQEAIELLSRALAADRSQVDVQCDLARALTADDRPQEALPLLRRALRARPGAFLPHYTHALTLFKLGRYDEAETAVRRALALAPGHPAAHLTRGLILEGKGWYRAAAEDYRRVVELEPGNERARVRQGNALVQLGRIEEGLAFVDGLLAAGTDDRMVQATCLLALLHSGRTGDDIRRAHARVAAGIEASVARLPPAPPRPEGRRLRIGYLSPDFRQHSVAFFFEPILARHDRKRFEVFCYHCNTFADEVTARLKGLAERWVECGRLDDETLAAQIRADGIDVLVDLAGPTAGGRPGVLARKPARAQAEWLGYPAPSGLASIDVRISDARADPPRSDAGDGVVRLPASYFCYAPPRDAPAPSGPPCRKKATFTFGSFNTLAKVSDECVALWAGVLARVPDARLLLKAKALAEPAARAETVARFAAYGIAPERLLLRGWSAKLAEHFAAYSEVDVALDNFPYNGGTTTCHALWMGVPVVSLVGERQASRMGLSILTAAGRAEWCAEDASRFAEIAASLAADTASLAEIRARMREQLQASALMDAAAFTAALESALEVLGYDPSDKK